MPHSVRADGFKTALESGNHAPVFLVIGVVFSAFGLSTDYKLDIMRYSGFAAAAERVYPCHDAPKRSAMFRRSSAVGSMSANGGFGSYTVQGGLNDT